MELGQARAIANIIVEQLTPLCQKVEIAGSIRRNKQDVKDIEIVAIPITYEDTEWALFEPIVTVRPIPDFTTMVEHLLGKCIKGSSDGKYMQIELPEGIMLDLFMPAPKDWGRTYALRTGSAEYSHKVLANGWNKIGFVGSDMGLRKQEDCERISLLGGKYKWKCINPNGELPPIFDTEQSFFDWIGVPYLEPENRTV